MINYNQTAIVVCQTVCYDVAIGKPKKLLDWLPKTIGKPKRLLGRAYAIWFKATGANRSWACDAIW